MGFLETLLLIFIVLKLAGLVAWSWWFVLSPIWFLLVLLAVAILFGIKTKGR